MYGGTELMAFMWTWVVAPARAKNV